MVIAHPVVKSEVTVTFSMPAGTAKVLYDMFFYEGIAKTYSEKICGSAISVQNIERTVEDIRDNLGPALHKIKEIDRAVDAILHGHGVIVRRDAENGGAA